MSATICLLTDPCVIAAVVEDVSGYSRWRTEVTQAVEEIKRTHKALQEINENIMGLVSATQQTLHATPRLP
jgi:oligoribonuclease (3'-5' exoribonuclease)